MVNLPKSVMCWLYSTYYKKTVYFIEDYPFLGAIKRVTVKNTIYKLSQNCGCALISQRHIVTAAHCFDLTKNPNNYYVLFGHENSFISWRQRDQMDDLYGVKSLIIHEAYSKDLQMLFNDIALAVLIKPVIFKPPNIEMATLTDLKYPKGLSI